MALKVGELFASFNLDSSGVNATMRTIENNMEAIGANMASFGAKLDSSLTSPLESFAKQSLSAGMDFTSQMSMVEAISGATAEQMVKLNAAALEMGSTTQFTATEAGEALEYMAMAGWKTDEMLAGLAPIMNLAAASGENLGTVSDIVTDALTAFGLKADDAAHFSDILAVASSNANTNVSMMGETFKYVAPVAGALGYKAEDVAVAIGLMANSGIKAGQAGTALRAALSQMANPSDRAATAMDKLGLSLTYSNGEMKPFNVLISDMRSSFAKLTEAEKAQYAASIFGQEAMSGMLAIINASDEDIQKLTNSIYDCDGATDKMAKTVLDNAKGDLTLFKSAVEGAQVALFTLNEDAIRGVIQSGTKLVDKFNKSSNASKQLALKMGILAAAIGPVMMAGGQLLLTLSRIGVILGMLVSPIGIAAAGLGLFAVAAVDADNAVGKTFIQMSRMAQQHLSKIDKYVQSAIASVSARMPELISHISHSIRIALPQMTSTAVNIISSLAEMIGSNADGLLDLGVTIIESIVEGLSRSLPNIVRAGTKLVTGLIDAFTSGRITEALAGMIRDIKEGLNAVDWPTAGKAILTSITGALNGLSADISAKFTAAKQAVEEISWSEISTKIKSGVTIASDWLKGVILGDTLTDESTWKDVGSKVWSWIRSGFSAAESWLKNLILGEDSEGAGWSDVGDRIVGKISDSLASVTPESLAAGIGDLSAIASAIVDKVVSSKANFAAGAGQLIAKLVTGISTFSGWDALASEFQTFAGNVVTSIVNGIGKVTGAASDVATAIGTVLSGITVEDVTTATSSVAELIINGVVAGIKAAVTGASMLAGALANTLENINEKDYGETIGTLAADLLGYICKALNNITEAPDVTDLMLNIGNGMKNAVASIGDIAGEIARYITSPEGSSVIIEAGKSVIGSLMMGMAIGLGSLGDGLASAIHSVLDGAVRGVLEHFGVDENLGLDAFQDTVFENTVEGMLTAAQLSERYLHQELGTILDQAAAYVALEAAGFGDELGNFNAQFSSAGIALVQALQSGMLSEQEATMAIAGLIANNMADGLLGDEIAGQYYAAGEQSMFAFIDAFGTGEDALVALCQQLGLDVPQTLSQAIHDSEAWTTTGDIIGEEMNKAIASASSGLYESGKTMVEDSVVGGVADGASESQATVQAAADSIMNTISGLEDRAAVESDAKTTGQTAGGAIGTGMTDEQASVQTAVQTLIALMNTTYQPIVVNFGQTTRTAMLGICNGVNALTPSVINAVRNSMTSAVNTAKSIMSASAGSSIGRNIMQGVVNGINSMSGTLASAARRAISNALSAMRSEARINSPSKEGYEIGSYVDIGAANGFLGGEMAKAAATAMANAIHALSKGAYISDPSFGTVLSDRQNARQVANETARSLSASGDDGFARQVGTAMADRLIESGALDGDIYLSGKKVGERVTKPVSQNIAKKSKSTISGRAAQGVIV
ncbi:MAG: phage tail tape measure protein [Clostridia bacterium]|nr:phage tail tape measure protein [Clostridia bacterium]